MLPVCVITMSTWNCSVSKLTTSTRPTTIGPVGLASFQLCVRYRPYWPSKGGWHNSDLDFYAWARHAMNVRFSTWFLDLHSMIVNLLTFKHLITIIYIYGYGVCMSISPYWWVRQEVYSEHIYNIHICTVQGRIQDFEKRGRTIGKRTTDSLDPMWFIRVPGKLVRDGKIKFYFLIFIHYFGKGVLGLLH